LSRERDIEKEKQTVSPDDEPVQQEQPPVTVTEEKK